MILCVSVLPPFTSDFESSFFLGESSEKSVLFILSKIHLFVSLTYSFIYYILLYTIALLKVLISGKASPSTFLFFTIPWLLWVFAFPYGFYVSS